MNLLVASLLGLMLSSGPADARQAVTAIVQKIERADYEGDRAALKRLHDELSPYVADRELGSASSTSNKPGRATPDLWTPRAERRRAW